MTMTTTPNDAADLLAENKRLRNELNALDKALRCEGLPLDARLVRAKELAVLGETRADGMPRDPNERYLRRMLAVRVAMPHTYCDDGEAQGQEHGISIDFMREPVADIDGKLRALNVARYESSKPTFNQAAECSPTLALGQHFDSSRAACLTVATDVGASK